MGGESDVRMAEKSTRNRERVYHMGRIPKNLSEKENPLAFLFSFFPGGCGEDNPLPAM